MRQQARIIVDSSAAIVDSSSEPSAGTLAVDIGPLISKYDTMGTEFAVNADGFVQLSNVISSIASIIFSPMPGGRRR